MAARNARLDTLFLAMPVLLARMFDKRMKSCRAMGYAHATDESAPDDEHLQECIVGYDQDVHHQFKDAEF